ncbi:MAG: hypothetical protein A3Q59_04120 [Methanomethylophilus alvi]|nr:MAG: hypothetical protein A3Q59_04120 [Methanomethylophilus alvi]
MKDIIDAAGIDITELSKRIGVSRPTVYKYIKTYREKPESVPENVRTFFERLLAEGNLTAEKGRIILAECFPTDNESVNRETDKALETLIEKFCAEDQTGYNFMPVVLPTGARKTSSVVNFIANYIKNLGERRILFVTTLKKNLPVSEISEEDKLRRSFEENGIGSMYDEKVLVVDSLPNMLKDNYPKLTNPEKAYLRSKMGDSMADELDTFLRSLREAAVSKIAYDEVFDRFKEFESGFRFRLARLLKEKSLDPEERKKLVTQDNGWKWVSKIYPTVYTADRQIFLMSMDKFVSTHDTIVDGRYSIYDSKLIDNAIIFIDEFDATKTTVLKSIIERDKGQLDYAGIFKRIYRTLEHNGDIWKEYYRMSEEMGKSGKTTMELIEELFSTAQSIAEDYSLELDFKLDEALPDSYLFRDNRLLKTGNNNEYCLKSDYQERINRIICIEKDKENNEGDDSAHSRCKKSITTMLGRMYNLFRFFEGIMFRMAMNHYLIQSKQGKSITREEAIRTVLDPYDFNESQLNYLVNTIKFRPPARKRDRDITPDLSFYTLGFEIFNFVDDTNHNLATKIYCKSIKRTPEKMLLITLDRSHNAKIIGISATARLPSVVGNYDFRYLKSQESFSEYKICSTDRERLRSMFKKTIDCYDRVNIVTSLITDGGRAFDYIRDTDFADEIEQFLESFKNDSHFTKRRYIRVFAAYYKFLRTEDLRSMLCFMNLFPKSENTRGEKSFSRNILEKVFTIMVNEYCEELSSQGKMIPDYIDKLKGEPFVIIRSSDFDKEKQSLLDRLSKGEKIFVFTTYSTVGAGQNLQYLIPTDVKDRIRYISSLADPKDTKRMDFNGIYLDLPTNIISNVSPYDDVSLLTALFSIESMLENNEMNYFTAKKEIDVAFKRYFDIPGAYSERKGMEYPSYRMAYARTIIQAVGRVCRTFAKNLNIYIMADDQLGKVFKGTSLRDYVDPDDKECDLEDVMVNPEFRALFNELQNSSVSIGGTAEDVDVSNECIKTYGYIESLIRSKKWSSSSMRSWKAVREYVLRFPTIAADAKLDLVYNMYTKLPVPGNSVRYSQEKDYKLVRIGSAGECEVSQSDARLEDFLKIPCVRPLFGPPTSVDFDSMPTDEELIGIPYAESFAENTAIMCPTLYHNIYKGALGEVAGTAILKDWGIDISEITEPDKFEKFDAVTSTGVYLDFKHWYGSGGRDDINFVKWAFRKLKTVGGKKAIIINILKPTNNQTRPMGYVLNGNQYSGEGEDEDYSGLTLVTVPYLYDCNGKTAIMNAEAKNIIEKEVKE